MHRLSTTAWSPLNASELLYSWLHSVPSCQSFLSRRAYATSPSKSSINHEATDIAILGGGITGLASAYFLTLSLPNASITLFEASPRLGGWLHSKQVNVGTGNVVFEQGPRNLRPNAPNGLVTLGLVRDLGLEDRVLMTSKNSVAAQNRFIYYPDHLVRMPGPGSSLLKNIFTVCSESVFDGTISEALAEVTKPRRSNELRDESIGSFLSRRFGPALTDNVVSAVFHGIYAGDVYKLSARSILPGAWQTEWRYDSIIRGLLSQNLGEGLQPIATADLAVLRELQRQPPMSETLDAVKKSSVFTFKGGIGELADRLEAKLLENPKVDIRRNTLAKSMVLKTDEASPKVHLTTYACAEKQTHVADFSHAISTVSGDKLAFITDESPTRDLWPTLGQTDSVTVMVVNLFFSNPGILPVHGFGYLLPRSIPFEQNPERALGVVFDSDASIGQDSLPGTKVTVMLGGHWWDDFDTYPDDDEGASMARAILKRHLGVEEEPQAVRVSLQHDCIPQYAVGHDDRMADASIVLDGWKGRLRVAGNSYTGVGLNDCVRAARDVVKGLVDGTGTTGLESFVGGRKWSWIKPEEFKMH